MTNEEAGSRIGVLGGSFNPVHLGHLILAQSAVEALSLSKVLFIPCARAPHKEASALADAHHRLAMARLAVEGDLRFTVSDMEIQRDGISYTVDTMRELCARHPDAEFTLIVGADTLPELHTWHKVHELLGMCHIAAFARPGFDVDGLSSEALRLDPPLAERLARSVFPGREVAISSSDIRHRVAEGMGVRYLVPSSVEMYIAEHGLYE